MDKSSKVLLVKLNMKCSEDSKKAYLKLHKLLMGLGNIEFRVFPLYITYRNIKTDKVFVVIYPKREYLDVGISYKGGKTSKVAMKSAKHMKYPGITKSIVIKKTSDLTNAVNEIILGGA